MHCLLRLFQWLKPLILKNELEKYYSWHNLQDSNAHFQRDFDSLRK